MSIFSLHTVCFGRKRDVWRAGVSPRTRTAAGFTLIELLAVSAIIIIITMVLLLRQSSFDSSTVLRSAAYSVALSIRQAQVYGVSVLGSTSGGAVNYAPAYGLYFSNTLPTSYILFADFNNNGVYDAPGESVKVFSLNNGYSISEACAIAGALKRCTAGDDSSGTHTTNAVSVIFKRPNPDAIFRTDAGGESYASVYIRIQSPQAATRSILVSSAGQIQVQSPGTLP